MNGQDLEIIQQNLRKSMEDSNLNAYEQENLQHEKTRDYEIELAKRILELREEGVQASIVEKVAKGHPPIAQLKFEAGLAEASARASKENINIKKKVFESIENTKRRELG